MERAKGFEPSTPTLATCPRGVPQGSQELAEARYHTDVAHMFLPMTYPAVSQKRPATFHQELGNRLEWG